MTNPAFGGDVWENLYSASYDLAFPDTLFQKFMGQDKAWPSNQR
jgi:hypothetical protein